MFLAFVFFNFHYRQKTIKLYSLILKVRDGAIEVGHLIMNIYDKIIHLLHIRAINQVY